MSHFTVLVPASDENELFQKLLPYYEYGCSAERDELVKPWLKFNDVEEEYRQNYATETVTRVKMPDGRLLARYDDEFRVPGSFGLSFGADPSHKVPEHLEQVEIPVSQIYPTFEAYVTEYAGYRKDEETGKYGYWHNPNAKWDWYSVGGRWTGLLKLKEMTIEAVLASGSGEPGLMTEPNSDLARCDFTLAGLVDWEGMQQEQTDRAMTDYRAYHLVKAKVAEMPLSAAVLDAASEDYHSESVRGEWIRRDFSSVEQFARYRMLVRELRSEHGVWVNDESKFSLPEEEYRKLNHVKALTFGFIDLEGKWNERGNMGWWAIVTDENPNYDEVFWKFVESLSDNQRVYVVDCHI